MFTFDEELFNNASKKIESALLNLDSKKNIINELNSIGFECEFTSDIQQVCSNISKINDLLDELNENINNTKRVINLLNELSPSNISTSIVKQNLSTTLSPFSQNGNGFFGSNQAGAYELYEKYILEPDSLNYVEREKIKEMLELFYKYGITDDNSIDYILYSAMNVGCGYAAITNVICDYYHNNTNENVNSTFKEKYGYPLYYIEKNGTISYNFETIFLDMFLSLNYFDDSVGEDHLTNKKNKKFKLSNKEMYDMSVEVQEMPAFFEQIVNKNKNLNTTSIVIQNDISLETYKKCKEEYDYCIIAVYSFKLKPYGNNPKKKIESFLIGGHWMTVTGISENGNYIVSSWGYEWELIKGNTTASSYDGLGIFPIHTENDGGLIFLKVGDNN